MDTEPEIVLPPEGPDAPAEDAEGIELEDAAALEAGPFADLDVNAPNLVAYFKGKGELGKKFLRELGQEIYDRICSGWDASEGRRKDRRLIFDLITGKELPKQLPYANCANIAYPMLAIRWLRLVRNTYSELYSDRESIGQVKPTGVNDSDAHALTKHAHWRIDNELTDFFPQRRRGIGEFYASGDVFAYSYRDTIRNANQHDILTPDDVVFPWVHVAIRPDMSDVPWKAVLLRLEKHEVRAMGKAEGWDDYEQVIEKQPPGYDDERVTGELARAVQDFTGVKPNEDRAKDAAYLLYKYFGYHEIEGIGDRHLCVMLDEVTKTVVKLYVAEEEDWRDRLRYDREMQQIEQFTADTSVFEGATMARQQMETELDAILNGGLPNPVDPMSGIDRATEIQRMAQDPALNLPPPPPPPFLDEEQMGQFSAGMPIQPKPVRMVPIEMMSHGINIELPLGPTGMAQGTLLKDLNILQTESFNRFYDSATGANAWGLLYNKNLLKLAPGQTPINPFQATPVDPVVDDIRKAVYELRPGPANTQLLDAVRIADEEADGISISGVIAGEAGKSGETFRGVATRMERAVKQVSASAQNFAEFDGQLMKNDAKLVYQFVTDEDLAVFQEQTGIAITRDMYRRDYRWTFTTDFSFKGGAQKIAEADEIVAMVQSLPPLQMNGRFMYEAVKGALLARGRKDLVEFLGAPPPPPTAPDGRPVPMQWTPPPPPPPAGPGGMPPGAGPMPSDGIPGPKPEGPPQ